MDFTRFLQMLMTVFGISVGTNLVFDIRVIALGACSASYPEISWRNCLVHFSNIHICSIHPWSWKIALILGLWVARIECCQKTTSVVNIVPWHRLYTHGKKFVPNQKNSSIPLENYLTSRTFLMIWLNLLLEQHNVCYISRMKIIQ